MTNFSDSSSTLYENSPVVQNTIGWNSDGITKYIPENIVDTSPLKMYTLDEQARIYIDDLLADFPKPQIMCPESDLNNHLLRLGLLYYPEHGFNYGLSHLGKDGSFPLFRAACQHHGVYLTRHPGLFHGKPSKSKLMRTQIANSLYPIPTTTPLPSQLTFDKVYDLIVGRLLHARTCVYIAELDMAYTIFMQALYIAQMSGMLSIPTGLDELAPAELSKVEIQLSIVNALLKMDLALTFMKGSDYVIDDSNYNHNVRLQDMHYRKLADIRQIKDMQGRYILNDFGFVFEGSRIKTIQNSIFFIKFLRSCIAWNFKRAAFIKDRTAIHLQILEVMTKYSDDGYKLFIPSTWKTPVSKLNVSYVSTNIGYSLTPQLCLILIHTGNVTNRKHRFCAQKNGPEYYTSADIIYGCIHTVARICYYFQVPGSLKNDIKEPFADHLLPPSLGTGTWAMLIYGVCSNALVALSRVCLKKETVVLINTMILNHVIPILKLIGNVWGLAELFSEWLQRNLTNFASASVIDESGM
ncbi:hypothetical protein HDV03_001888 [Kappamyces sp. JEL0829]|nr:hypothetical protein HDV03_001888 [Kappamyces sp. JEL0829]